MEQLINHPDLFRVYLESITEPIAQCVGFRHDPWQCPIASWLSDTLHRSFAVNEDAYQQDDGYGLMLPVPLWIHGFVTLIDSGAPALDLQHAAVSKHEALATLDLAERQAAQLLLPQKAESLIRCDECDEWGRVWVTVVTEREETFHLCWEHFTKRFPVQKSVPPAREPVPA